MLKILRSAENAITSLSGISIGVMMVLTTVDTVGRYFFNTPIRGAYEFTEKYLMTVVFLGVCYAYRQGAHVRLTFLIDRLPHTIVVVINYFVQGMCIVLILLYTIATTKQVFYTLTTKAVIDIRLWSPPLWTAYTIIPLGTFFLFLAMLTDLWHLRTRETGFFKKDGSESPS